MEGADLQRQHGRAEAAARPEPVDRRPGRRGRAVRASGGRAARVGTAVPRSAVRLRDAWAHDGPRARGAAAVRRRSGARGDPAAPRGVGDARADHDGPYLGAPLPTVDRRVVAALRDAHGGAVPRTPQARVPRLARRGAGRRGLRRHRGAGAHDDPRRRVARAPGLGRAADARLPLPRRAAGRFPVRSRRDGRAAHAARRRPARVARTPGRGVDRRRRIRVRGRPARRRDHHGRGHGAPGRRGGRRRRPPGGAVVGRGRATRPGPGEAVHVVAESEVDADVLLAWVRDRLDPERRPRTLEVTSESLRDDTGKVRRSRHR